MKKKNVSSMHVLSVLLVLGFAVLNAPSAHAQIACPEFTVSLRFGSVDGATRGQVSLLQKYLAQDTSIYPEGLVTGYFGRLTENAVKAWQMRYGVLVDGKATGFFGPLTRAKVQEVCLAAQVTMNIDTVVANNGVFDKNSFQTIQLQQLILRIQAIDRDYVFEIPGEGVSVSIPQGATRDVEIGSLGIGTHQFICGAGCGGTITVESASDEDTN